MWRTLRRSLASALALCLAHAATAAPSAQEVAVKAAYLAKFAPFVVWPQAAFAAPNAPLVLCVQGDDPFDGMLDQLTAGQSVGAHPVIVRRMARLDPDFGCQIAYLARLLRPVARRRAESGRGPAGADGDRRGGEAASKGIVHLVLVDGRVRFMIDAEKAGHCQLGISSKLLALAVEVKR